MSQIEIEILREIRDLLTLIAEPQLEARDKNRRDQLRKIVGRSAKNAAAVLLMNGDNGQKDIAQRLTFDPGNLSRLVKALGASELLDPTSVNPKIVIPVTDQMFERD